MERIDHSNIIGFVKTSLLLLVIFISTSFVTFTDDNNILSYTVNPAVQDIRLYWKDDQGKQLNTFDHLKQFVESKNRILLFAMNGGMYKKNRAPQGLFIENQKIQTPLDTFKGDGNFYLFPNGVFYLTVNNKAGVCKTEKFKDIANINYATQSGPMLLIDGAIHPAFKMGSKNLNVRNGVGILPDNRILFAISTSEINFYDFAQYFKSKGCKNALYLDGFVSRVYLPEQNWIQMNEDFGVMIGVTERK